MEPDPNKLHIGGTLTKEQLAEYNYDYRTLRYSGIMETLMRYHTVASRKRRAAKWRLPKKPWQEPPPKFEDTLPNAIKEWFRIHQREEKKEYFQPLEALGIPSNTNLIDLMELENEKVTTLGDRIWLYESKMLRAFAPVNMSHRYRGVPNGSNAIKSIFVLNMLDDDTQAKVKEAKKREENQKVMRNDPFKFLRSCSISDIHFRFLRALAAAQLVTLPFSIQETCLEDVVPSFEHVVNYYCVHMREDNQKVQEVQAHHSRLFSVLESLKRL